MEGGEVREFLGVGNSWVCWWKVCFFLGWDGVVCVWLCVRLRVWRGRWLIRASVRNY